MLYLSQFCILERKMQKRKSYFFSNCAPLAVSAIAILCSASAQAAKVELSSEFEITESINSCNLESKINTSKQYKLNMTTAKQRTSEYISGFAIAIDGKVFNGIVSDGRRYSIVANGSDVVSTTGTIAHSKEMDGYYQSISFNPKELLQEETFSSIDGYIEISEKKKQKAETLKNDDSAIDKQSGYYLKIAGLLKDRGVITTVPENIPVFPNQKIEINYTVLLKDGSAENYSIKIPSEAAHKKVYLPFDKISKKIKKAGIKNFYVHYDYAIPPEQSNPTAGNVYYSLTLLDDKSGWFGGVVVDNGQVKCDETKLPIIGENNQG